MFAGTHAYFAMQETRTCGVNYFCFGALLIFIGSILFCALGFVIILPFESTKSWQKERCTVITSAVNTSVCACEEQHTNFPGCEEYYPCLQVYVTYKSRKAQYVNKTDDVNTKRGHVNNCAENSPCGFEQNKKDAKKKNVTVYSQLGQEYKQGSSGKFVPMFKRKRLNKDENTGRSNITAVSQSQVNTRHKNSANQESVQQKLLYRSWKDIYYKHCTLQECGDKEWNVKSTRKFHLDFGRPGKEFDCYVDPHNPQVVIMERTPFMSMLHAVLWPSLCLFIGIVLWMGLCCGCWSIGDNEYQGSACYTP